MSLSEYMRRTRPSSRSILSVIATLGQHAEALKRGELINKTPGPAVAPYMCGRCVLNENQLRCDECFDLIPPAWSTTKAEEWQRWLKKRNDTDMKTEISSEDFKRKQLVHHPGAWLEMIQGPMYNDESRGVYDHVKDKGVDEDGLYRRSFEEWKDWMIDNVMSNRSEREKYLHDWMGGIRSERGWRSTEWEIETKRAISRGSYEWRKRELDHDFWSKFFRIPLNLSESRWIQYLFQVANPESYYDENLEPRDHKLWQRGGRRYTWNQYISKHPHFNASKLPFEYASKDIMERSKKKLQERKSNPLAWQAPERVGGNWTPRLQRRRKRKRRRSRSRKRSRSRRRKSKRARGRKRSRGRSRRSKRRRRSRSRQRRSRKRR